MTDPPALLDGLRVLDLATPRAEYAGRVLADLGAEVLKVEPPGGAEARRLPPFDERPGHEGRSLAWAALALGKRSVVIDLDAEAGRERLRALAARADVLLESHDPGWMAARGLGFEALAAVNLALVYVSVAPFGQAGPKSAWPATDLTLEAACGRMSIQGDLDRVPVPVGYPQAAFHAGAQAAADALIALNERALSGRGQHLDTSIQAVMVWTLMDGTGYPTSQGADPPGGGEDRAHAGPGGRTAAPIRCRDGWVIATVQPMQLGAMMPGVIAGLGADATAEVAGADWAAFARMLERGVVEPNEYRLAVGALSQLVATRTKAELIAWAAQHDVQLAPVNTARDLLGDEQLAARGYWREVGDLTHAGPPALLSRTLIRYARAAPALGEGEEVAARWLAGDRPPFAPDPFALSRSTGAGGPGEASNARTGPAPSIPFPFAASASSGPSAPSASKREGGGDPDRLGEAFAGLRVADFSWVAAGPIVVKALADHGATVVRVESATRLDLLRRLPPFKDGVPGPNRAYWYNNVNTSKLGLALDLSTAEGRGVARRLVDWADVVVESFTPGTMARFGLGYGAVSHERPDLIMLSTCLLGQTGPRATYAGYGSHGAAIAGLHAITGWPDRPPTGPAGPYTDVVAPRLAVPLLAAAVLERRRSGLGQHIDFSQVESAVRFVEPLVLDAVANGRDAGPAGLDSLTAAPHGVYRAAGAARYVAIAVERAEQWRALRAVVAPALDAFADARFDALEARRADRAAIDEALAAWCAQRDAFWIERALAEGGVPASVVQRMSDLHRDPQLAHRGFFVTLRHHEVGPMRFDGLATRFSAKRVALHRAAPALGQDAERVLGELLGYSPGEIRSMQEAGVLE